MSVVDIAERSRECLGEKSRVLGMPGPCEHEK